MLSSPAVTPEKTESPETPEKPESPETPEKRENGPRADKRQAKGGRERRRNIIVALFAMLALTAVLTLVAETVSRRPAQSTHLGSQAGTTPLTSAAVSPAAPVVIVSVGLEAVIVDGVEVTKTAPLIESKQVGNIESLKKIMDIKRGNATAGGRVGLEVQKGMPTNVVKSVLLTLALAGYRDVHRIGGPAADASDVLGDP